MRDGYTGAVFLSDSEIGKLQKSIVEMVPFSISAKNQQRLNMAIRKSLHRRKSEPPRDSEIKKALEGIEELSNALYETLRKLDVKSRQYIERNMPKSKYSDVQSGIVSLSMAAKISLGAAPPYGVPDDKGGGSTEYTHLKPIFFELARIFEEETGEEAQYYLYRDGGYRGNFKFIDGVLPLISGYGPSGSTTAQWVREWKSQKRS